jgi:hypothetical protein
VGEEPTKIVESLVKGGREAQPSAGPGAQGGLEVAEQTAGAGESKRHRAQFSD